MMEAEIKPRRLRILTGKVEEVEDQLNRMLDDYGAIIWSFYDCAGAPWCSVVLVSQAEMRKAAFMQAGQMGRR